MATETKKKIKGRKRPKVGLALGSGGAKGISHIGVIKVLEDSGIPIDIVAGSSIGALIGGFYAVTKDIKEIEKKAIEINWKKLLALIDPSLHQGLIGGNKIKDFIENYVGKKTFKDCKIPFLAVATDLETGETVFINEGEIALAIRASISIPLVFKPVRIGNRLLADGGLSLPVPVEAVRKMGAEVVVAVNLDNDYFDGHGKYKDDLGFYRIAYDSIDILRYRLASYSVKGADVIISPKIGNVGWDNFLDSRKTISIGEEAAREMMPKLKEIKKFLLPNGSEK